MGAGSETSIRPINDRAIRRSVTRTFWRVLLAFATLAASRASAADGDKREPPDEPPLTQLVVSPAAEPVPALKYRLLPLAAEETHGNGALDYRLALRLKNLPHKKDSLKAALDSDRERLSKTEIETLLAAREPYLAAMELAAHRDSCDWQLLIARDRFKTAVEEFQAVRIAAQALAVRAGAQIAHDDLAGALSSMSLTFKMSRDCDKAGLLITTIIGCAAAANTTDTLEAFVQHPQAPNLYWALTDLPSPLIDCRPAVEGDVRMMEYEFPQLAVLRSRRLSVEEARRLSDEILKRWIEDVWMPEGSIGKTFPEAQARFASACRAANDKRVLLDLGWSKADVVSMPPEQAAWLISDYHWRVYRDEMCKWAGVPTAQRAEGIRQAGQRLKQFLVTEGNPLADFEFVRLAPAAEVLYAAVDRRDRPIALFRVVEALRLFAAAHRGELPASLEAIDAVPIPVDPMSGKPFLYHRNADGTADLQTPALHPNNRTNGRHFAIRVRQ
jgi:hypothetical protein